MKLPYNEAICRLCPFNDKKDGTVTEPVQLGKFGAIRYINCLRDNEGAKEHFCHTLKDDNYLWLSQTVNFEKCLFDPENIPLLVEGKVAYTDFS
ncbi:MAG: hypothetical protein LBU85_00545 [Treponema sp.]|jgi:hypothetical protein|nr:hypothetical protein [Treponema sp.]